METLMIRPKKSDFLAQARPGQRFAVVHEMPADRVTPVDAFYATGASYLLESAERGMQIGRYSFLGISPDTKIEIRGTRCRVHAGAERREHEAADPLRIVGEYLRERPYIAPGDLSPLPGGAVGYIGFDMVSRWERLRDIPVRPGLGLPDAMFICTRYNLVFDNLMHTLKIICNVETGEDLSADFDRAVDGIRDIAEQIEAAARGGCCGGSRRGSPYVPEGAVQECGATHQMIASASDSGVVPPSDACRFSGLCVPGAVHQPLAVCSGGFRRLPPGTAGGHGSDPG